MRVIDLMREAMQTEARVARELRLDLAGNPEWSKALRGVVGDMAKMAESNARCWGDLLKGLSHLSPHGGGRP